MARRQGKTQREQMRLLVFMQGSVLSWPKKCIFHSLISGKKCKKLKGWQKLFLRNIKGANLLVDPNGRVKLADFGMAKHISGQSCPLSFKGSPYWMAPEVIKTTNSCSLVVDVWSLGCTVLEMATSKPPWSQYEGAGTPHFGAFTTGLVNVLKLIQPIKDKYSGVTYADLFQLASATAIEEAGGPKIPMKYGRVDVTGPEQCPAERKLPG
ncbi:mitogen-activated protein kinase kinase kinase 9-like isoform X2 [Ananas comosus]|nr:mitogen-activated protein kinase kinase kinase 9-like isoform X2 [Ananas comosus]